MSEKNPLRLEIIAFFILGILFILWAFKQCNTDVPHTPRKKTHTEKTHTLTDNNEKYSTLYVTVDSLNMRVAPHLDSTVVARIPQKEAVTYYGLRTSFQQKININKVLKNEPWVYVRTEAGKEGWVYAGGLAFYKIK